MSQHVYLTADSVLFWLVALIAIGIIFIGARFIVAPRPAARDFGVPASDTDTFTYLWTKGTRDIVSGLLVIGLLCLKVSSAVLAAFLFIASLIPFGDLLNVYAHVKTRNVPAPDSRRHGTLHVRPGSRHSSRVSKLSRFGALMSFVIPSFHRSVIARGANAEEVGGASAKVRLLVDSSAAGGALSTVRVTLERGADGARPHRHDRSAEMFYVLGGAVQVLSGTEIVNAEPGDVIVVPPRMPHAFSTRGGAGAELLIVIAPGVERFEYFRQLTRIARGEEPPESLRDVQELYDTWFLNSPEWEARG